MELFLHAVRCVALMRTKLSGSEDRLGQRMPLPHTTAEVGGGVEGLRGGRGGGKGGFPPMALISRQGRRPGCACVVHDVTRALLQRQGKARGR